MLIDSGGGSGTSSVDVAHALRDALRQRAGLLDRRARQDHHELLAAVAGDEVAGAGVLAQHGGDLLQRLVAVRVPEAVVDGLEEVEVHHEQREGEAVAGGALRLDGQGLLEVPVVVEAGQAVGHGAPPQLLGRPRVLERARRDVGEHLQQLQARLVGDPPVRRVVQVEERDHLLVVVVERHEQGVVGVEHAGTEVRERAWREVEQLLLGPRVALVVDEVAVVVTELVAQHAADDGSGDAAIAHHLVVLRVLAVHRPRLDTRPPRARADTARSRGTAACRARCPPPGAPPPGRPARTAAGSRGRRSPRGGSSAAPGVSECSRRARTRAYSWTYRM